MIHRFQDYLEPVTCISSGNSLVAIGSKFGKIYVYQSIITQSGSVHITAILAHHAATVHKILFHKDQIISCSDDMTVGIVSLLPDGALVLSKILKVSSDKIREIQTSPSPSIDKLGWGKNYQNFYECLCFCFFCTAYIHNIPRDMYLV